MNDLISRQDAIDVANNDHPHDIVSMDNAYNRGFRDGYKLKQNDILEDLANLPSAQQKTGKWLVRKFENEAKCSECGFWFRDVYDMNHRDNYCRHCGAKMEELELIFI